MKSLFLVICLLVLGCTSGPTPSVTYRDVGRAKVVAIYTGLGKYGDYVQIIVENSDGTRFQRSYYAYSSTFVLGDEVTVLKHPEREDYLFDRVKANQQ